jgi:L-ascorbate metabolism protein UlaG (beta-lactamase superfamily)
MEITWLGHSCFKIKGKEVMLVTDPYSEGFGHLPSKLAADIVTLSHHHPGHNWVAGVGDSPKVVSGPGEYEIADVFITGIYTFHDSEQGKSRGKNTAYLIEIDEIKLCHLGDIGHLPSPEQVEGFGNIQVLLTPVGGVSTVDAETAAEIVRLLNPKIVIPMHYRTEAVTWLEPVGKFLNQMGVKEPPVQPKVSVTPSNLPSETQVVVLDYAHI